MLGIMVLYCVEVPKRDAAAERNSIQGAVAH
jgi:hypothetical protein